MFLFWKNPNSLKCCDLSLDYATNGVNKIFYIWSTINYACYLCSISILFWGNFILIKNIKQNAQKPYENIMQLIMASMNNKDLRGLLFIFCVVLTLSQISNKQQTHYKQLCNNNIINYINKLQSIQIKAKLFDNYQITWTTIDRIERGKDNLLDLVDFIGSSIIPLCTNVFFSILLTFLLFSYNTYKVSVFLIFGVLLFIVIFLTCVYLLYNKKSLVYEHYINDILTSRRFNLKENFKSNFHKEYKLFEDYVVNILYFSCIGLLIPIAALNLKTSRMDSLAYLILCCMYLWKNVSQFASLFSFYAKEIENQAIASQLISANYKKMDPINEIKLYNFPLEKKGDINSNIVTFTKDNVYMIVSLHGGGKTEFVKQIFQLVKKKDQRVVFNKKEFINYSFSEIADCGLYINPNEIYDGTIKQCFLAENSNLTDKMILDALAEIGILEQLNYQNVLEINISKLSNYERLMVYLSKICLGGKSFIALEDVFRYMPEQKKNEIFDMIRHRFSIIIFLTSDPKLIDYDKYNVYFLKNNSYTST